MIVFSRALLLKHPVPVCYGGLALVYLSLAILSRHNWTHAVAYGAGAALAITLAASAVLVH